MKMFQIVIFALTIVSVICSENIDKRSNNIEQNVFMNQGEYFTAEDASFKDQFKGFNGQFGDKVKTKKYYPPEPKEKMQYMIIKRTREVPVGKKYLVAHSSSEMTSYHNKHPSKTAYSIAHKPKAMPFKVVQEGSVKHIYLDMPDLFDDVPQVNPTKIPQLYDNINQGNMKIPFQFNGYKPGQFDQNNYQPTTRYPNVQTNINSVTSGISQAQIPNGQEFNTVSSGYRVGNNNENKHLNQGFGQQFSSDEQKFNTVSSAYTIGMNNENNPLNQGFGQQFALSGQEYNSVAYKTGKTEKNSPPNQGYGQQFQAGYPSGFQSNIYSTEPQVSGISGYPSSSPSHFGSTNQNEYSNKQFPQFSVDGKERYSYEIPDQYKSLFANNNAENQFKPSQEFSTNEVHNNYAISQFGQSQQLSPKVTYDNNNNNYATSQLGQTQEISSNGAQNINNYVSTQFGQPQELYPKETFNNKNNNYATSQFGQHQEISPNVGYNQQEFDFSDAEINRVSGFDPNLINIVNDVLNNGQGYPTPDGFRMIKSSDDKSIYLVGKPGMPLDAVPNIASYNFSTNSPPDHSQTSDQIKFA